MGRRTSPLLSPALLDRLSQTNLRQRLALALPFVTVDEDGRPHPMLVSYLEVRAYDPRSLGLVIQGHSTSSRNLRARRAGTLVITEPEIVAYVKTRLLNGPLAVPGGEAQDLAFFRLEVEQVIEDSPADWEGGTRITGAIHYSPAPDLEAPWARATLAALAQPGGKEEGLP